MSIDKVSFTGSTATGKEILRASLGNLKRVTLELGGKSPHIVMPDADIGAAARNAAAGFAMLTGQVCVAGTRILVHESVLDDFAAELATAVSAFRVGDPFDEQTMLGPVVSAEQFERVNSYVSLGVSEGARIAFGGGRFDTPGYFVEPTVFAVSATTCAWRARRSSARSPRSCRSATRTRQSALPTTPSTGSPPRWRRATCRPRTAWPGNCARASCGSTRTRSWTRPSRSAGTSNPASGGSSAISPGELHRAQIGFHQALNAHACGPRSARPVQHERIRGSAHQHPRRHLLGSRPPLGDHRLHARRPQGGRGPGEARVRRAVPQRRPQHHRGLPGRSPRGRRARGSGDRRGRRRGRRTGSPPATR